MRWMYSCAASLALAAMVPLSVQGAPPPRWMSRGVGGGGAFFGPSISPHNHDELFVASDMSDLFCSKDLGASWSMFNFRSMKGHQRMTSTQFTSNPNVLYGLNATIPAKSTNAGASWVDIPVSGVDPIYSVFADPNSSTRLLVSDATRLYFSSDGGQSYTLVFTSNSLHVAGAFFNGSEIFVGTRGGLLVSSNSGVTFRQAAVTGIASTEGIVSFAGARENGTNLFLCVTWANSSVYPGVMGTDVQSYRGVYRLLYGRSNAWSKAVTGFGTDLMTFVAMTPTNMKATTMA